MLVKECFHKIPNLVFATQSPVEAFDVLKNLQLHEIPIVELGTNRFLGLVSEEDLLSDLGAKQVSALISPIAHSFVFQDDSCLEALRLLSNTAYSSIPVLDNEHRVLGLAHKEDLFEIVSKSFHYDEPGSVILILVEKHDFSMHAIMRIVEQEGAKVLACSSSSVEGESNLVRVTLKLNQFDSGKIVAALKRYNYVVESISDKVFEQDYMDKADEFLHFLNI